MRTWRVLVVSLTAALIIIGVLGCNPFSTNQQANQQQIKVSRGDLAIKVNGSGKIKVDSDANLTFGNNNGKITKLNVKEGAKVKKGDILAQLETDSLELSISQANNGLAQARLAEVQAESNLAQAQFALDQNADYTKVKNDITKAEWQIQIDQSLFQDAVASNDSQSSSFWAKQVVIDRIDQANKIQKLADMLAKKEFQGAVTYNIMGDTYGRVTLEDMQTKQLAVQTAQKSIDQTKANIDLSQRQIANAQKQLADATIVASITGVVANLDLKVGDTVVPTNLGGKPVIYLVDPSTMQTNAEIDEIDIANVKLGLPVNINLDALPGKAFPGTVNFIDLVPVANPQNSGVVVYNVKVGFVGGIPPEVKIGMSATVDIITGEHKNVILIPSRAITTSAGKTVVTILANQKTEERAVETGLTDGINTEITSGLNEGEIIVISRTAS
jgi:HlyD family secretion protein